MTPSYPQQSSAAIFTIASLMRRSGHPISHTPDNLRGGAPALLYSQDWPTAQRRRGRLALGANAPARSRQGVELVWPPVRTLDRGSARANAGLCHQIGLVRPQFGLV
jgi:hypothetical protein